MDPSYGWVPKVKPRPHRIPRDQTAATSRLEIGAGVGVSERGKDRVAGEWNPLDEGSLARFGIRGVGEGEG